MLVYNKHLQSSDIATRAAWPWSWKRNYPSKRRLTVYQYTRRHIPENLILPAASSGFVVDRNCKRNRYFHCPRIEVMLGK